MDVLILARAIVAMESEVSEGFLEWVVFELALRECDKDQQAERKFLQWSSEDPEERRLPFHNTLLTHGIGERGTGVRGRGRQAGTHAHT